MERSRQLEPGNRQMPIAPVEEDWDVWFEEEGVTDDFMLIREQPGEQHRDDL